MKTLRRCSSAVLALCGSVVALANSTQQVTINAVVPMMMNLTVDTNNVALAFAQSDYGSDGTASKQVVNGTTFRVSANSRWRLLVSSNSLNFSYHAIRDGHDPRKDCNDLELSAHDTSHYFPVTTTSREIANGTAGGSDDSGHRIPVSYKLQSTLVGDPPGVYTLTITYTLMPR
ncbi:MAG TPA: hypothetical protein VFJ90_12415 [Candidatus Didemnitutus sp.]|nr:hypothetical protein [Candidatus Didemnitutus sp.]